MIEWLAQRVKAGYGKDFVCRRGAGGRGGLQFFGSGEEPVLAEGR